MREPRRHEPHRPRVSVVANRAPLALPARRLAARYEESLRDGDVLSLVSEVALTDARLEDLLRRVDSGESGKVWEQLKQVRTETLASPGAATRKAPSAASARSSC